MELRHLRYFLAVCEELHFGRAAKRVHISQPPLSQQIRQLEEEMRVKLFSRTKRRVELTEAGRVFAGEARLILQQVEHASKLAVDTNRTAQKRLLVGFSPANCHVAIKVLKQFSIQRPETHLVVKSLPTPQQIEALSSGHIDLGFVTLPFHEDRLVVETILSERLMVALPARHALASAQRLSLHELASETLIIFPLRMSPGRYESITSMCRKAGFSLHTIHEVDDLNTMLELVRAGLGVSLMRQTTSAFKPKGVVYRELRHSPTVETGIAYMRRNRLNDLALFMETARREWGQPGAVPGVG
jgi:DNA-binding transcriptional LysR family regulator